MKLRSLLLASLLLAACSNEQRTTDLNSALNDYNAGQYQLSYDKANHALPGASGAERERANYIAGLSAFKLNRLQDAERHMMVAAGSADREVSGKARATLGHIRMKQERPGEAAAYFKDASERLTGEEAAKASYEAGVAYRAAGEMSAARSQLNIAATSAPGGSATRENAQDQLQSTGFALQIGVFADRANALRAYQEAQNLAAKHRLGSARMTNTHDQRGRTIYVVQVGGFGTRDAAERARTTVGRKEYVVRPVVQ